MEKNAAADRSFHNGEGEEPDCVDAVDVLLDPHAAQLTPKQHGEHVGRNEEHWEKNQQGAQRSSGSNLNLTVYSSIAAFFEL